MVVEVIVIGKDQSICHLLHCSFSLLYWQLAFSDILDICSLCSILCYYCVDIQVTEDPLGDTGAHFEQELLPGL